MSGFHSDTRETPEQVAFAEAQLEALKARFLRCQTAAAALGVPDSASPLGRIDVKTTPFQISEQIKTDLHISVDHLRVLLRYLAKTHELPMVAFYALIRPAIEATSYAIWSLWGSGDDRKASRSLRISLQNFKSFRTLGSAFNSSDFGEDTEAEIRALHARLKGVEADAIYRPGTQPRAPDDEPCRIETSHPSPVRRWIEV